MCCWSKRLSKRTSNFETTRSKVRRCPEGSTFTKYTNTSLTTNRVTSGNNVLNKECCCCTCNFKCTKWTYFGTTSKNMSVISIFWCVRFRYKTVIFSRSRCSNLIWNCICRSWCNSKCCTRSNLDTSTSCSSVSGYCSTIKNTIS